MAERRETRPDNRQPPSPDNGDVAGRRPSLRWLRRIPPATLLVWLLILAYVAYFAGLSIQRHVTLNSFAADLSFIDQPMWNTLHGHFLERTMDARQVSRVAEHLEPIILPVALVFYLWDDVKAILVIQTIVLALGALPVYWIARHAFRKVDRREWIGLAFAFVYLAFPALEAANVADFHADPFIVTPLLFAFWYATLGRYRPMWIWALVAMLVKENLPTLTFMLGLYVIVSSSQPDWEEPAESGLLATPEGLPWPSRFNWGRRQWHGLAMMVISLAWFLVATFVIVAPLARQVYGTPGPVYLAHRYSLAGESGVGILGVLAGELLQPQRLLYLAGLFASVGWLALLAPEYLLLGLPVLVANTLSDFPGQYSGEQHYSAPLAPVFVIAAIYGAHRLWRLLGGEVDSGAGALPRAGRLKETALAAVMVWLLAWSLGYHYLRGWTPLARDFEWPVMAVHQRLLARFVSQIPDGVPVSTTPPLHPHLAHRQKIYIYPTLSDAKYVLLDVSGPTDAHPNDVRATYEKMLASGDYGVVDAADGYVLLSSQAEGHVLPDAFYDFARTGDARPEYSVQVEFAPPGGSEPALRLVGYDVLDDRRLGQVSLRLYWQALEPLPEDVTLWPFFYTQDGFSIEDVSQRPMVEPLWYPPRTWRPGEVVTTHTLPWDLGQVFNVGVAVLAGDQAGAATAWPDPAHRFRITNSDAGVDVFHDQTWAQIGSFEREDRRLQPRVQDLALIPRQASFSGGIQLLGYRTRQTNSSLSLVLEWQADLPLARDYTVFVHLVTPGGEIVAQSDAQPAWVTTRPTSTWTPGVPELDGHLLALPPDLPQAGYLVRVGWYDWQTLERLPVLDGQGNPLGEYVVLNVDPAP